MPYTTIPFGPYEPDRAEHAPDVTRYTRNALPVRDGWGPMPSLVTFTQALPAEPRGAFVAISPASTVLSVAGTATKLYALQSDTSWTDVSISGDYTLPAGDAWNFALYGSRLIAAQVGDTMQYYDIGSSSDFDDLTGAPQARYVAVVGEFVVAASLSSDPAAVQWSGIGNSEQWTPGEALSDIQTFPDGGKVQGILPLGNGAVIFQERVIRSMGFAPGSAFTFTFSLLTDKRGTIAPGSICKIGDNDFIYLAEDGWYRGLENPIGETRINDTFFADVDIESIAQTEAKADVKESVVWIRYPSGGIFKTIGYNWVLDRWFAASGANFGMASVATSAVTIDGLAALYSSIDDIDVTFDSRFLSGGRPGFGGFDKTFRYGFYDGAAVAANISTATTQLNAPRRTFVRSAELMGDVTIDAGTSSLRYWTQDYQGSELEQTRPTTGFPHPRTGIIPLRTSARNHRFEAIIAAGSNWRRLSGIRLDHVQEGGQ